MAATYSALNHKTCQPVLEPVAASSLAQRRSMKKLTSTDMLWTEASSYHCALLSHFVYLFVCSFPNCLTFFPQLLHIIIRCTVLLVNVHQGRCLANYRLRDWTEHGWKNPKIQIAAGWNVTLSLPFPFVCILWKYPFCLFSVIFSFSLFLFSAKWKNSTSAYSHSLWLADLKLL